MILRNLPIPTQGFSRALGALRRFVIQAVVRMRHGFFPKRYLLLAILLVALVVSVVPQPTNACEVLCVLAIVGVASLAVKFVGGFLAKVGSDLLEGLVTFANWLLEIIGTALWALAEAVARFFTWTLVEFNQSLGFIDNDFVQVGWSLVRDVANWLFVIFFLISAIATILNLQKYNARAILPKLIMLAILVNFSLWITGFAVNIAQVVMTLFVVDGAGQYGDIGLALAQGMGWETANVSIAEVANEITESTLGQAGAMFLILLSRIIFALAAIFIFLWLALMLFVRIIYLWIAMILSPLAFASAAFPKTQPFFSDWLKQFTNWATFGIFAAFFVWLAAMMSAYLQTSFSSTYVLSSSITTSGLMGSANLLMRFITIFVFLWLSYSISKKAAGKAGQFVEGAMKTALLGVGVAGGLAAGGLAAKGIAAGAARGGVAEKAATMANRMGLGRVGERLAGAQQRANARRTEKQEGRNLDTLSDEQFAETAKTDAKKPVRQVAGKDVVSDRSAFLVREAVKRGMDLKDLGYDDKRVNAAAKKLDKLGHGAEVTAARPDLAAAAGITKVQKEAARDGETISKEDAARETVNKMSSKQFADVQWASVSKAAKEAGGEAAEAMLDELNAGLASGKVNAPKLSALVRKAEQGDSAAEKSLDIIVPQVQAAAADGTLDTKTHDSIVRDPAKNGHFELDARHKPDSAEEKLRQAREALEG